MLLRFLSQDLKDDYDIVMEAVKQNGRALSCASVRLQDNPQIVIEAITEEYGWRNLAYASKAICNNKEVMLHAVKVDALALDYASEELRNDKDIIVAAINQCKNSKHINPRHIEKLERKLLEMEENATKDELIEMLKEAKEENKRYKAMYEEAMQALKAYEELNNSKREEVCIGR